MTKRKMLEWERRIVVRAILYRGQKFTKVKEKYQDDMERLFALLKKVTERIKELEKGADDGENG